MIPATTKRKLRTQIKRKRKGGEERGEEME
jgi:hypothetical protein